MRTVSKVLLVLVVAVVSLTLSIGQIQSYLWETTTRERTLSEKLVQQQMEEQMAEVATQVEQEMAEQDLVIEQAEVELLPPAPTPEPTPEPEPEPEETDTPEEEILPSEEPIPEESATPDVPADTPTYLAPTDVEDIENIETYLVENYFLNGYDYANAETDPELKAQKELACAMEAYVVDTMEEMFGLTTVISSLDLEQAQVSHQTMVDLQAEFQSTYAYLSDDATFGPIYDATLTYFAECIVLTSTTVTLLEDVQASTNLILALSTLMTSVDTQLMPQIDVVIQAVFDMKALTNAVYLQGTDAVILTTEDAQALIDQLDDFILGW